MEKSSTRVVCPNCAMNFDGMLAEFCVCSGSPSLRCPSCGECSCGSPWNQAFWQSAPRGLIERRRALRSASSSRGSEPAESVTNLIIVADDSRASEVAGRLLGVLGFDVSERRRGVIAMKPSVAKPSRMTGRQIYGILRADLAGKCPTLVVMTAADDEQDEHVEVFTDSGVDRYSVERMAAAAVRSFLQKSLTRSASKRERTDEEGERALQSVDGPRAN